MSYATLLRQELPTKLSTEESEELLGFLASSVLRKALRLILHEHDEFLLQMRSADLSGQIGISAAIKVQGKAEGLARAVDVLAELAAFTEEEEEDGTES